MSRIIGIDYGEKRIGIAITDPEKVIAFPLQTVNNKNILISLEGLFLKYDVQKIVIGWPLDLRGKESKIILQIKKFIQRVEKKFKNIEICKIDERFTSKIAYKYLLSSGLKKSKRKDKSLIDDISACLILRSFLTIQNNTS